MKICWNNLEKLEYIPDSGEWRDKNRNFWLYRDSCKNCGEPFLYLKAKKGLFCDPFCANSGENHPNYGKKRPDISKMLKQRTAERSHAYKGGYYIKNIPAYDTYAHKISFCEEVKRNKQDQNILEVKCAYCGKWYVPTRIAVHSRAQAMNGEMSSGSEHRFYCSDNCKQECPIFHKIKYPKGFKPATSREVQPQLRQLVFERDNYTCQKCDKTQDELETGLHCHHLTGVEINPIESADVDNCIALCKNCHIEIHKLPGCGYNDFKRKKCKN